MLKSVLMVKQSNWQRDFKRNSEIAQLDSRRRTPRQMYVELMGVQIYSYPELDVFSELEMRPKLLAESPSEKQNNRTRSLSVRIGTFILAGIIEVCPWKRFNMTAFQHETGLHV